MIFKTTSRSASAGSTARYVLPEAPWPSSESRRNGPSCSPTSGKSVARERGHSKRSQLSSSSSSAFHWGNRVVTSAVTTCSPASRRRQTSSYTSRTAFSVLNSGYCFKSSSTVIWSPRAQAAAIARTWRETHSLSGPRQRTELVRAGLNEESTGSAVSEEEEGGGMGHSFCGAVPGEVFAVLRGTASRR